MPRARAAFTDLLRIRASSTLFRLRSADDVARRLRFHATGRDAEPGLIAATLDGDGLDGAGFATIAFFLNPDLKARYVTIAAARDRPWRLHPVQAATDAADARPREQARFDRATGAFRIPPRSAVVYVVDTASGEH